MGLQLAVLISGHGTNLAAIVRAIEEHNCDARVELVVSDRPDAAGLEFARAHGIDTDVVRIRDHADRATWNRALADRVARAKPELVVLAGFMRLLGETFLDRFPQRVINVHPALLPLFPGTTGPEQALAAGMRVTGCSVHLVDAGVDTGPVIAQGVVPILPADDARSLHERIQRVEHMLLPRVIAAIARGQIRLSPSLTVDAAADPDNALLSLP